ncbi:MULTISPECIES: MmgE/PrpD family protein [unclassified Phenylobacterium]|uniref:MmgE/PrpD family protein n=1 Tax=unclassified Phenylobacterium TaxID=2640670 RepID=UPI00083AABC2|nr:MULTISPECIES: MmgE/PrpD family protein [unclassified Phenylobacterium]
MTEFTKRLVSLVAETDYGDLSEDVVRETKRTILDSLGCILSGYPTEIGDKVTRYQRALGGGAPQATVLATGEKINYPLAAFVNAKLGNALDYDDVFETASNIGVPTVTAALGGCEFRGRSGKDLIASVALGYEIGARVGVGFGNVMAIENGQAVGIVKRFGKGAPVLFAAAGAVSKAFGLGPDQIANTLGIAGALCPVPAQQKYAHTADIPDVKYADSGWHTQAAVSAALLTEVDYSGFTDILDGQHGFPFMYGRDGGFDYETALEGIGQDWLILENTYKLWPASKPTCYALGILEKIYKDNQIRPEEIDRIVVYTFSLGKGGRYTQTQPKTITSAEFSLPHVVAVMTLGLPRGPQWHSPETRASAEVNVVRDKVEVDVDPRAGDIHKYFVGHRTRRRPTSVEVFARGKVFKGSADFCRGDPWEPDFAATDDELKDKFRELAAQSQSPLARKPANVERLLELIDDLEAVDDVRDLVGVIAS